MVSVGIAVPCFHGHINNIKNLLNSIEKQTKKPDYVIISCSGINENDIPYKQEDYSFPLKFITTKCKLNTAQNRNIAANTLNTDVISFIDADDIMHPQCVEIIEKAFKENNIVFLVHRFTNNTDFVDTIYDNDKISFDIGKLGISPVGDGCIHLTLNNANIHNGHCSISKKVLRYIKYGETPKYYRREDSDFTINVVNLYPRHTAYCSLALTNYIPSGTFSYST
jgi:glycosyltransferase involved in cell wall biosynthesis